MIKTIIIDDEPSSRKTLALMLNRHKDTIELLDSCASPAQAIESIANHKPDLIFLDIEMPVMNGFEMLRKISNITFEVIFTTAYDQYAINAIRYSALDYLLKPISSEDLSMAIDKCCKTISKKESQQKFEVLFNNIGKKNVLDNTIALSSSDGITIVKVSDIVRCEASGRYTKIYFANKQSTVMSRSLKDFEDMLPATDFFRIHDSQLINLSYLKKYIRDGTVILSDDTELMVSRRKKEEFVKLIFKN